MQRDGARCLGRSNKSTWLPSPSGPLSHEDRQPFPSPANCPGSGRHPPSSIAMSLPLAGIHLLFCCPSLLPHIWCWGCSPLCHAFRKEGRELCPQQERVSFPSVQAPFPGRLSLGLEAKSQGHPFVEEVNGEWDFLGSESG